MPAAAFTEPQSRRDLAKRRQRRRRAVSGTIIGLVGVLAVIAAALFLVPRTASVSEDPVPSPSPFGLAQSGGQSGAAGGGLTDLVEVEGNPGATPVVSVPEPLRVATRKWDSVQVGHGRELVSGTPVLASVHRFSGRTGESLGDGAFLVGHLNDDVLSPDFCQLVEGQREGARLLVAEPRAGADPELIVVDILPTVATGKAEDNQSGPLTVEMTDYGPIVTHAEDLPSGLTVQTLLRGSGPQLRSGDLVVTQHLVAEWSSGTVISSTWGDGLPTIHGLDDLWPGLRDALLDQRVGSRLAVTVPVAEATGQDTIVAVIDILGAVPQVDAVADFSDEGSDL